jgi:general secretion pathway protein G
MSAALGPHREVGQQIASAAHRRRRLRGYTLLELALAGAVLAILAAVAVPSYRGHLEKLKVGRAAADLRQIALAIERFRTAFGPGLPDSLKQLPGVPTDDPWGTPYQYLNFASGDPGVTGKIRKDHNLHPLNSEFDLYSMGADGDSKAPLTAKPSRDDVIWARDGGFVGLASDF